MDGQRRGVVDEESSVLDEEEASVNVYNLQLISFFLFFSFKNEADAQNANFPVQALRPGGQCLFSTARTSRPRTAAERLPGWRAAVLAGRRRIVQE